MKYQVNYLFCGSQKSCMFVNAENAQEAIRTAKQTIVRNMPSASYGVMSRGSVVEVCSFSGAAKHTFRNFSAKAI